MNTIELDTKFFTGGNSIFTVDNGQGVHYTFKIRQPRKNETDSPFKSKPYFVSLLTGSDNEHSYTYLGIMNGIDGSIRLTKASKYTDDTTPVKVIRWTMKHVFGDRLLPDGYSVNHSSHCGCCGRLLTEPLSLKIGIGPECRKRLGM